MVSDGDGSTSYRIHQETSVLGYDRNAGTLDMLVRFDDCGGHCPAHRHVTTTSVLVLEGERHLDDMVPGAIQGIPGLIVTSTKLTGTAEFSVLLKPTDELVDLSG